MKGKILLILILVLTTTFLAGCQKNSNPYIKMTTTDQNIIKATETFSIRFFIYNPTVNTFVGTINYTYDTGCLGINAVSDSEVIEIPPNGNKPAVTDFAYVGRGYLSNGNYVGGRDIQKCYNTPLKISVALSDKSGYLRDNKLVYVTVTK